MSYCEGSFLYGFFWTTLRRASPTSLLVLNDAADCECLDFVSLKFELIAQSSAWMSIVSLSFILEVSKACLICHYNKILPVKSMNVLNTMSLTNFWKFTSPCWSQRLLIMYLMVCSSKLMSWSTDDCKKSVNEQQFEWSLSIERSTEMKRLRLC